MKKTNYLYKKYYDRQALLADVKKEEKRKKISKQKKRICPNALFPPFG